MTVFFQMIFRLTQFSSRLCLCVKMWIGKNMINSHSGYYFILIWVQRTQYYSVVRFLDDGLAQWLLHQSLALAVKSVGYISIISKDWCYFFNSLHSKKSYIECKTFICFMLSYNYFDWVNTSRSSKVILKTASCELDSRKRIFNFFLILNIFFSVTHLLAILSFYKTDNIVT